MSSVSSISSVLEQIEKDLVAEQKRKEEILEILKKKAELEKMRDENARLALELVQPKSEKRSTYASRVSKNIEGVVGSKPAPVNELVPNQSSPPVSVFWARTTGSDPYPNDSLSSASFSITKDGETIFVKVFNSEEFGEWVLMRLAKLIGHDIAYTVDKYNLVVITDKAVVKALVAKFFIPGRFTPNEDGSRYFNNDNRQNHDLSKIHPALRDENKSSK